MARVATQVCVQPGYKLAVMSTGSCPYGLPTCTGCQGRPHDASEKTDRHLCVRFEYPGPSALRLSNTTPPATDREDSSLVGTALAWVELPASQRSENMRMQLAERFLDHYFPARSTDTDFLYSRLLWRDVFEARCPGMQAAIEVICLAEAGTSSKNNRLLEESLAQYYTAVDLLQSGLENGNAVHDDGVLGTMYLLSLAGAYTYLQDNAPGYRMHVMGLKSILSLRGPDAEYSRFAQMILYNTRHLFIVCQLHWREAHPFQGPGWSRSAAMTTPIMGRLTELTLGLPGLLELVDKLSSNNQRSEMQTVNLLTRLTAHERDLHSWFTAWYSKNETAVFWTQPTTSFPAFHSLAATAPDVLPRAVCFNSFSDASAQCSYWVALVCVKQSILDLHRLDDTHLPQVRIESLVSDVDECAHNLGQSTAFLTQKKYGTAGILRSVTNLTRAMAWFLKRNHTEEAEWCRTVQKGLEQERGVESPFLRSNEQDAGFQEETASEDEY